MTALVTLVGFFSTMAAHMINISRQTDYACRVLLHLALCEPGARTTAREIAQHRLIPQSLVRRVVAQLSLAGLVKTTRGADGGISLARPPCAINLLDVVEATEGALALNACVLDARACPLSPACPVHEAWCKARLALVQALRETTFDKLACRGAELGT